MSDYSGTYQLATDHRSRPEYSHIVVTRMMSGHYVVVWHKRNGTTVTGNTWDGTISKPNVEYWASDPTIWVLTALAYPEGI